MPAPLSTAGPSSEARDFALLETMLAEGGQVFLVNRHLDRLASSARHFGYLCDTDAIRAELEREAARTADGADPVVLRLLMHRDGRREWEIRPVPAARAITFLQEADEPVDLSDPFLYHKTTSRAVYDRARQGCSPGGDVILYNERGEATETTIANIAVERAGLWVTPPISCGLLAGTLRAELLERGELTEGVVLIDEIEPGELVRCLNSVRGVYDVPLKA